MFQHIHSSGISFTYSLTYHTRHSDHLVKGFECTKKVTRKDTPSVCLALVEHVIEIVSHIVHLNGKIYELRRKYKHGNKLLAKAKKSTLTCSKCEGYGHDTYQCLNWNTSPVTNEDLKDYILYFKEKEERT